MESHKMDGMKLVILLRFVDQIEKQNKKQKIWLEGRGTKKKWSRVKWRQVA